MRQRAAGCSAVFVVVLRSLGVLSAADQGPVVTDTSQFDQLDAANQDLGPGDVVIGNGESVATFNGNLSVIHASSGVLPHDGSLVMALGRSYNSASVRNYRVLDNGVPKLYIAGRSWIGLGWSSHLGRILRRNSKRWDPSTMQYVWREDAFFQFPNGTEFRFEPSVVRARPMLGISYHKGCTGIPPACEDICDKFPEAACCDVDETCNPEDPVEHYDVTFPGGTKYRLEKLVPFQYITLVGTGSWIKNHDRAGFYTTKITDVYGNSINIEYWGAANPNYPEAIKSITSGSPSLTDERIETTLCVASDPDPVQCPAAAEGLLKEVRTTACAPLRNSVRLLV